MLGALYRAADAENWSFNNEVISECPRDFYERLLRVKDRSIQFLNNHKGLHMQCDPWGRVLWTGDQFRSNPLAMGCL
jgi:hypothetical protein